MEELSMKDIKYPKKIKVGDLVTGTVIDVKENLLTLDLQTFTEGFIYLDNYSIPALNSFIGVINVGDKIDAVVGKVNEEYGSILLSRLSLLRQENTQKVMELAQKKALVEVKVKKALPNKGMLADFEGVSVFIPIHEIELEENGTLDSFVGKVIKVKFIEQRNDRDKDRRNNGLSASLKQVIREEARLIKENEYNSLKVGDIIKGVVSRIEPYGVFLKMEHNAGLIRHNQLTHHKFKEISEICKVGDEKEAKVIKKEDGKIELSFKALLETPFQNYIKEHKVSDVVSGTVFQKLPFGVIVELSTDVFALLHRNEMSWNPNDNSILSLKIGDEISAAIINLDNQKEKIGLSKKVLLDNPWSRVKAKAYDITEAQISKIIPGKGLNVLCFGVDGFIPVGEITMKGKSTKIEDYYALGDTVKAMVTDINVATWELKLSIKQYTDRLEREHFEDYMKQQQEEEKVVTIGELFDDLLKK